LPWSFIRCKLKLALRKINKAAMILLSWNFWIVEVIPIVIFAAAVFFDLVNQGQSKSCYKSYLPLYVATICILLSDFSLIQGKLIEILIFLSIIWFLAKNWHRFGLNLFIFGVILNQFVRIANNGKMPVFFEEFLETSTYQALTDQTLFPFLSDWINFRDYWMSIGDIFMFTGILIFFLHQTYIFLKNKNWRGIIKYPSK
jgi:hypothetical protein